MLLTNTVGLVFLEWCHWLTFENSLANMSSLARALTENSYIIFKLIFCNWTSIKDGQKYLILSFSPNFAATSFSRSNLLLLTPLLEALPDPLSPGLSNILRSTEGLWSCFYELCSKDLWQMCFESKFYRKISLCLEILLHCYASKKKLCVLVQHILRK